MNVNISSLKKAIKQKNPRIYRLIANNKFDGKYVVVKTNKVGGWVNRWLLSVKLFHGGISLGGLATITEKPMISTKSKTRVWHVSVMIDPKRAWVENFAHRTIGMTHKTISRKQLLTAAADTLLHELVHAQILIDKSRGSLTPSKTTQGFQELLKAAKSPQLRGYTSKVISLLKSMIIASGTKKPNEVASKADLRFERLINEKYASSHASCAFGNCRPNSSIAKTYGELIANRIVEDSSINSNPLFKKMHLQNVKVLIANLNQLYNALDCMVPPSTMKNPEQLKCKIPNANR